MKPYLNVSPVKRYPNPKYPTKQEVMLDPQVLKAVPKRWSARPAVSMVLLATLSTGLCSCMVKASQLPGSKKAALAIPVFQHGDGRGSYGCSSVAPPVFLSEEEAAQVIRLEAETMGVMFDGTKSIEGIFPATDLNWNEKLKDETWQGTLQLDGYDEALDIGFEFVSQKDVVEWQNKGGVMSTVESYDMLGTAERLAKTSKNLAVFYDPGEDWKDFKINRGDEIAEYNAYVQQYTAEQKERMLEDLRLQVRDFLSYLSAQGVI
jgi:hypothetical protein